MLHKQILTQKQTKLLPLVKEFSPTFYLVGGTAIALHIGHRRSIDFDLFTQKTLNRNNIKQTIKAHNYQLEVIFEDGDQIQGIISDVRFTFFEYPYPISAPVDLDNIIKLPNLLTLAAMKAYALGKRAKWKDYVDLYFILIDHHSYQEVTQQTQKIFGPLFNEKLFRQQLTYYQDVNYSEPIEYLKEAVEQKEIENYLTQLATQPF